MISLPSTTDFSRRAPFASFPHPPFFCAAGRVAMALPSAPAGYVAVCSNACVASTYSYTYNGHHWRASDGLCEDGAQHSLLTLQASMPPNCNGICYLSDCWENEITWLCCS